MKDYSRALMKEIAAQKLGYIPSAMWGKLCNNYDLKAPKQDYENIMHLTDLDYKLPGTAWNDCLKEAMNAKSIGNHINSDALTDI